MKINRRFSGILLLVSLVSISVMGMAGIEKKSGQNLIVVPSRHTVVQLAFDIAKIRPVDIVAYDRVPKTGEVVLFTWSKQQHDWMSTSMEEFGAAAMLQEIPGRVILIGGERDLPSSVISASSWCPDQITIPTLDMLTLVNSLDHIFDFSSREWKWLAKEHQLELKDLNSDRRKYGRFGKPGEEQTVPMPGRTEVESTVTSETVDVISTVEETDLSPVEDTDIPPVEDKLPEDK